MNVNEIFQILWDQYSEENPSIKQIHSLFENEGETIINDHVAFRTFNDKRIGIDIIAKPFLKAGYKLAGEYHFEEKKLYAQHFEMEGNPRVFISELLLEKFSSDFQSDIIKMIDALPQKTLNSEDLIVSGSIFGPPSFHTYEKLRLESEYAAWVYAYGYRANHFTISINHLSKFDSIYKVNDFLKRNAYKLNSSGGEVKGTPQQLLEQSSTLADQVFLEFTEGKKLIPSCYYEFAHRHANKSGELFSGFIAGSADKIFESTDFRS
jgi:hypothetical protein